MARDADRHQVYAAEEEADRETILAESLPMERLKALSGALTTHPWWQIHAGGQLVTVVAGTSTQRSSYSHSKGVLRLGTPHRNGSTLCHELAHAAHLIAPGAHHQRSHGRHFRGWNVSLRWLLYGKACGDDLREVYALYELETILPDTVMPAWTSPAMDPSSYDRLRIVGRPFAE